LFSHHHRHYTILWLPLNSQFAFSTVCSTHPITLTGRTEQLIIIIIVVVVVSLDPLVALIGITGGFAPPTPTAIHTITLAQDKPSTLQVTSARRQDGTAGLSEAVPKSLSVDHSSSELVEELESILKNLPTEQPPGSEDIYGFDTQIFWGSENLQWWNGGPEGCGGGPGSSTVQVNDEQKAQFKRAVEIVNELTSKAS
jgi:hypothetical protein